MSDTRDKMQDVARAVQVILPPGTGFVVLAFDFDISTGRLDYVSNAEREGVISTMKEFLSRNENPEAYGEHLDEGPKPPGL